MSALLRATDVCTARSVRVLSVGRRKYHGRLRREELERKVVGAIGQGIDLIRDLLHGGQVLSSQRQSGGGRYEAWRE
jgi:hypothetical protein